MGVKIGGKDVAQVATFQATSPSPAGVAEAVEVEEASDPKAKKKKADPAAAIMGAKFSAAQISDALKKEKGKGFVNTGREIPHPRRMRTGIFELDLATGGGLPRGRATIVFGTEGAGKSNVSLNAIRECQRGGEVAVLIDIEHSFDATWASYFGVDLDKLIVIKPAYGEEAVDAIDGYLRADDVGLVVVDSIAVLTAAAEIEKSVEKFDVGTSSILLKRMCNKASMALAFQFRRGHDPVLLLLNQRRFKIGVMFGDPEVMPGGETIRFLSSLTLRMSGKNKVDEKVHPEKPVWKETDVKIKKAKIAIYQSEFKYEMALQEIPDKQLTPGQTDSFSTVTGLLKAANKLVKVNAGYTLDVPGINAGTVWKTQAAIEEQYICDPDFSAAMQKAAIDTLATHAQILEAKGGAY